LVKILRSFILALLGSANIGIGLKILTLTSEGMFSKIGFVDGLLLTCNGSIIFIIGTKNLLKYFKII
jgi:hypothetical protein